MAFPYTQGTTKSVTVGILICALGALVSGLETQLNDNYLLDYGVTDNNARINLNITAINVTGWVAIGINVATDQMAGSDWFVGGVHDNGNAYEKDYHGPNTGFNSLLTVDIHNDWKINSFTENGVNTTLNITRLLETGDSQDLPIHNKTVFLVWSYNNVTDFTDDDSNNTELFHFHSTKMGAQEINLLNPEGSGTNGINFGLGTLLVCLFVALFQNLDR